MKVTRVIREGLEGPETRVVVLCADRSHAVDVRSSETHRMMRKGLSPAAARRLATALVPSSLTQGLESGEAFLEALARAQGDVGGESALDLAGLRFDIPVDPASYRDFMAFEEHFVTAMGRSGLTPHAVLYELPVSYMGNAQAMLAHEQTLLWPAYTDHLDYELELGIVMGTAGRDISPEDALDHVFGITVLNDFSARDIQVREMAGGLGPSKGKHFGTALGPWITTLDELDLDDLTMVARINGEVWSESSSGSILWPISELIAWASASEPLPAGALIGSGTVGGGSAVEIGRKLSHGDIVELEISGIGVLRNFVGAEREPGWFPEPKISRMQP